MISNNLAAALLCATIGTVLVVFRRPLAQVINFCYSLLDRIFEEVRTSPLQVGLASLIFFLLAAILAFAAF